MLLLELSSYLLQIPNDASDWLSINQSRVLLADFVDTGKYLERKCTHQHALSGGIIPHLNVIHLQICLPSRMILLVYII